MCVYIYIYTYVYRYVYRYIHIHMYTCIHIHIHTYLRAKILGFGGCDTSIILILRRGILRSIGISLESLSQQILVGRFLVGRFLVGRLFVRNKTLKRESTMMTTIIYPGSMRFGLHLICKQTTVDRVRWSFSELWQLSNQSNMKNYKYTAANNNIIKTLMIMSIIAKLSVLTRQTHICPIHLLRVWISEGLTQADS